MIFVLGIEMVAIFVYSLFDSNFSLYIKYLLFKCLFCFSLVAILGSCVRHRRFQLVGLLLHVANMVVAPF